jgi:hypothetical protein
VTNCFVAAHDKSPRVDRVVNEIPNNKATEFMRSSLGNPGNSEPGQWFEINTEAPALLSWSLHRLLQSAGERFDFLGILPGVLEALPLLKRSAADVVLPDLRSWGRTC